MLDWIFISIGLAYLIPAIAMFRYYQLINTREYLIGVILFLSLTLNGIVIGIFGTGNLLDILSVFLPIFLLLLVTKRVLSKRYNQLFRITFVLLLIIAISNIIFLLVNTNQTLIWQILSFEFARYLVGLYLFFAYSNINMVIINRRTRTVKIIWQVAGIIMMIISLIRIADIGLYLLNTPPIGLDPDTSALAVSFTILSIGTLLNSLLTSIVSIFYPEMFLLSKYQLSQLFDLYDLSNKIEDINGKNILPADSLLEYLKSVENTIK